jgi:hypothetical protein
MAHPFDGSGWSVEAQSLLSPEAHPKEAIEAVEVVDVCM